MTVVTTLDFRGGTSALHRVSAAVWPLQVDEDLLATLSVTNGMIPAPILCCVLVSSHSGVATCSRADDIDAGLISLAQ